MKEFEYEKRKLKMILSDYGEVIENMDLMFRRLPDLHKNDPRLLDMLMKIYSNKLKLMKQSLDKPYFARIDFKDDGNDKLYQCYLGKVGVSDFDNNTITVDWRAPIANMYYDSNIGKTSYGAPEGTISGELLIKRQIDIENGILKRIQDVDTVSNDEILKPYLGVTADNRLKNIVSTIQNEQNVIIRDDLRNNLIVQGVAGSGKTTVALHRIAYLVYNHQKTINPDQYMVIGPNSFFLDYISNVLPDLDAATVKQLTFESLVQEYIDEVITINSAKNQLIQSLNSTSDLSVCKYKNSLKYKRLIDKFMINFDREVVPDKDFEVKGIFILPKKIIQQTYDEVDKKRYLTIESRIERTILLLSAYIRNNPTLQSKISSKVALETSSVREYVKKELRNDFNQSLKQYLSRLLKKKITTIYSEFIKSISSLVNEEELDIANKIKQFTELNIRNKSYDFDDLAALAYIKHCINGSLDYQKYRHTVIDEAQDYGDFNFLVLKKIMKNSSFSIYGDIAQSIYGYRSIDDWDSVEQVFKNNIEIKKLLKSYRTTIEIMEAANNITRFLGLAESLPVIRNGSEVGYKQIKTDLIENIVNYITNYQQQNRKSIAIITKTPEEAIMIKTELLKENIEIECIVSPEDKYSGGICVTTSYLSKGLEFDAVLITNVSEQEYDSTNKIDMKLLYVAMTRALHNLDVLYKEEITKPLLSSINKNLNL